MNFTELFDALVKDTLDVSLPAFMPEIVICCTIGVVLLLRIPRFTRVIPSWLIALAGSSIALWLARPWHHLTAAAPRDELLGSSLFTGMLVYDEFSVFFRALLLLFVVLFVIFTRLSGIPDREDGADFYSLIFGSVLGMCLMVSANHLLIVFLGVEMASVPSYALAGLLKGRRESSEAALKYAVYGAGAAGIMLYGISLLSGVLGSMHMPTMAIQLAQLLGAESVDPARQMVLVLGGLMVAVGLAFKLSAVPFHFWCPDVFEGASAEVNAFLSVASKAAALALLVRVVAGFGHIPAHETTLANAAPAAVVAGPTALALQDVQPAPPVATDAPPPSMAPAKSPKVSQAELAPAREFMRMLITLLAAVTCTFGNLAAYGQTNIKRLLAYSTIAHAGYLMMPVAAALALMGTQPLEAQRAIGALAFYVGVYLFMNLGAFAIVAFLRNSIRSEEIADYGGLIHRYPLMTVCLAGIFLSLIGIPPFAGFAAKFNIFAALVDGKQWFLLAVGGLNTVFSLFYYLKVIKTMTMDPVPEDQTHAGSGQLKIDSLYAALVSLPVLILGVSWNDLSTWARVAAEHLFS